jgi:hypothetical protein
VVGAALLAAGFHGCDFTFVALHRRASPGPRRLTDIRESRYVQLFRGDPQRRARRYGIDRLSPVFASDRLVIAVEVRNKAVQLHDAYIFLNACHSAEVARCHLITFAQEAAFDRSEVARAAAAKGVLMLFADTAEELVRGTFSHATHNLARMLADLPARVADRLAEIEAEPDTIRQWEALCRGAALNASPAVLGGC